MSYGLSVKSCEDAVVSLAFALMGRNRGNFLSDREDKIRTK